MVRARWSARLAGTPALRTAYSWESVLDEVVFVVGPPFITLLAARAGAAQALLATQAFLVVGTVWFVALRRSEPPRAVGGHLGGPSLLGLPGLRALAVVMVALGGAFGSVEVITVAFADELDRPLVAGAVLGLYAASSLVGGVVYGARATVVPLHRQLVRLGCLLPLPMLPLPLADRPVVLALLVTASGLLVAPTLIATFALVDQLVPAERLTEGLTWAMTGITFGISVGAAVSGPLVDAVGTPSAFAVTAACGLLTAGAAVGGARWLHPVRGPGPACGPPSAGAGRR